MFWKVLAVSIVSAIGVLLLEQYILLTREPAVVQCDAGNENPEAWIDRAIEKALNT